MDNSSDYSDEDVEMGAENGDQEYEEVSDSSDPDELDYDEDIEGDESDYVDECPVTISNFDLITKLGSGAYGTVFLARKNCGSDAGHMYALKVISKAQVVKVPKSIIHMRAERKALQILRNCPYIQRLHYAFQTSDKLFLVTEYLPGGEMFTQVQKGPLPEHQVRFYIAELIVALEHIHLHGIVYRDIKLENVLLDADGHVKLVDFGLCKKLGPRGRSKSFCGTEEYMAPEVVACIGHNSAADWWALGVLAIELLSTITPFGNSDGPTSIMEKITNDDPIMPPNISKEMEDFLLKILSKDPTERLGGSDASATKIKQHQLFNDIDWEKLENKLLPSPMIPTILSPTDTQNFSDDFTKQDATIDESDVPPNSFIMFKGYSYIAPELLSALNPRLEDENLIDENWNSSTRPILSNRDPDSEFYRKYKFASHHPLGSGKSSVCMECVDLSTNIHYAVKIYERQVQNDHEIDVLQKASEEELPGVLRLIGVLTDSKWTYLIMELIDGIDLLEYFSTKPLDRKIISDAFIRLWEILKGIHKLKYAHGRICFQNFCYLPKDHEFRLIGFGNAKPILESQHERIDHWSLGVCMYTMLCGHSPFNLLTCNEDAMVKRIEKDDYDRSSEQWLKLHKDIRNFIDQLLRSAIPTCNVDHLKNIKRIKSTPVHAVEYSKDLLDENKDIVAIRGARKEIKVEMNHAANGVDTVTNGDDSVEEILDNATRPDDVKIVRLTESQTNHTAVNGHGDDFLNAKRRNDQRDEQDESDERKSKKPKKYVVPPAEKVQLLKPEEIKPEPRVLRNREPKNYARMERPAKKPVSVITKTEPVEVQNDIITPPQTAPKTTIKEIATKRKGRPKKDQTATVPATKPKRASKKTISEGHSTVPNGRTTLPNVLNGPTSQSNLLNVRNETIPSRYQQWCYNFPRPVKMGPVYYCFHRFDYK